MIQLSEEDVDAIDGHPAVKRASKQIYKALEAITGWGSLPKNQFKLAVAFENALGQLKGAYVSATPLEELQRRAIFHALRETGGDKLAAARQLGIGKTTLYRKLKQYCASDGPKYTATRKGDRPDDP